MKLFFFLKLQDMNLTNSHLRDQKPFYLCLFDNSIMVKGDHPLTLTEEMKFVHCFTPFTVSFNFYHSSRWEKKDLPSLEITILAPRLSDGRVPTFGSTVSTEVIGELSIKAL